MNSFTVVLSADPERGGYSVSVPALPGAISEGDNREQALANIREAIKLVLSDLSESERASIRETAEMVGDEVALVMGFREEEGWDRVVEFAVVDFDLAAVA